MPISISYPQCLKLIIDKTDIDTSGFYYIKGKLNLKNCENEESILTEIDELMTNLNHGKVCSSYSLGLIFRCMVVSLRDSGNNLTEGDISYIENKLINFNEREIRNKLRENF